ncbi:MAG TPA: hypothetical protein VE291_02405 [Terracidiphilus sp.]|jgi:hypothetical protein|nr:hypothetical protein [Terracidiphilus sp.]
MRKLLAIAALALPIALAGCGHPRVVVYEPPPPGFSGVAQRAYQDGFNAGRNDYAAGRAPDARRHGRFRNPPVPPPAFEDYRQGFRAGYRSAYRGGAPGPGY